MELYWTENGWKDEIFVFYHAKRLSVFFFLVKMEKTSNGSDKE